MAKRKPKPEPNAYTSHRGVRAVGRGVRPEWARLLQRPPNRSAEGLFLIQQGSILECDRFLSEKAGYAAEEVVGSLFASFFDSQSMGRVESAMAESACPGVGPTEFNACLVCKNGDAFAVRVTSEPCRVAGKPARFVVLCDHGGPDPTAGRHLEWPEEFLPEESPGTVPECGRC
ncbi:MAG: hypothetical protein MUC33_06510 [Desulfobacterales bacterium]|jgi:hypothetical protein|nr:hypothetical protein [Desulfobacterales bacterium]